MMDIAELLLVAAAVLDCDASAALDRIDVDAAARALESVPEHATTLEQAAALLHGLVRERPFGDDSRAIAIVATAQVLDIEGRVTTFTPSATLFTLLDDIENGSADVIAVCSYISVEVTPMFERFTPRARNVITLAYEEAKNLHHNWLGTEHLLLGVLGESEGIGAQVLALQGVEVTAVRREVEHRIGEASGDVPSRAPFTPRSKKTLELALHEAIRLGHNYIGTEHIVLGLLRVNDGLAAEILSDCYSVEIGRVRNDIITALLQVGLKPTTRRSKPFMRPAVTWASPVDPALVARRSRILGDVQALLDENERLREEIAHLRSLLHTHDIDPGDEAAGDQPA
jgi:hypothetical protein